MKIKNKIFIIVGITVMLLTGCKNKITTLKVQKDLYFIPYFSEKLDNLDCVRKVNDGLIVNEKKGLFYYKEKLLFQVDFSSLNDSISTDKEIGGIQYEIYNLINNKAIIFYKYELIDGYEEVYDYKDYYKIFVYNYETSNVENTFTTTSVVPLIINNNTIYYYVKNVNDNYYNLYNEDFSKIIYKNLIVNDSVVVAEYDDKIIIKNEDNKNAIIDLNGNILVKFTTEEIVDIKNNEMYISKEDNKYYLYNFDTNKIILENFSNLVFTDNYIVGIKDKKLLIYGNGKEIYSKELSDNSTNLTAFDTGLYAEVTYETLNDSMINTYTLKINLLNNEIIPDEYKYINYFKNNSTVIYYLKNEEDNYKVYNSNFEVIIDLKEIDNTFQYIDNYYSNDNNYICLRFLDTANENKMKYIQLNFSDKKYKVDKSDNCVNKDSDYIYISTDDFKLFDGKDEVSSKDYTIFNKINDEYYFGIFLYDFDTYAVYKKS